MRSPVSKLGKFVWQIITPAITPPILTQPVSRVRLVIHGMEMVVDYVRDRGADPLNFRKLLDTRVFYRFGTAEMAQ